LQHFLFYAVGQATNSKTGFAGNSSQHRKMIKSFFKPRSFFVPSSYNFPHHKNINMAKTTGYVGTLESETRGVSRIWFSLTEQPTGSDWIKIGSVRAWFTMNMESSDRPSFMAELTLLLEAMRRGLHVQVSHGGAATNFHKVEPNDSFEVDGTRILRSGLHF
jgi:hypothetical protein